MSRPSPTVAAFDLDGTLTKGGSVFQWLRFLCGDVTVARVAAPLAPALLTGAARSGHWADDAKERLFSALLSGKIESEVATASREFIVRHLEHEGRADIVRRLRWHQREGHDIVIVSASPQLNVDALVDHLAIAGGLGTRLAVDNHGALTGKYDGANCRGREKMRRLDEWIASRSYDHDPTIYAYGNSRGDRRMLAGATFPFDVGRMGRFGALRNFPRLVP